MRKVYLLETILAIWLILLFLILFPAAVHAESPAGGNAASEEPPMIAFTFDDGPNVVQTQRLLDGLAERGAKASFFIIGKNLDYTVGKPEVVDANRALVERMVQEGHVVGNHSYSHCWFNQISKKQAALEISKTNELIKEVTGVEPLYMRPPGGASFTSAWLREMSAPMITVCWGNYDTRDWQCRNVDKMVKMIVDNTHDGDIILLHDNYKTSVDTALRAMDILAEKGFRFVTVDELLNRNTGDGWVLDPMRIYGTMEPGDKSRLKQVD